MRKIPSKRNILDKRQQAGRKVPGPGKKLESAVVIETGCVWWRKGGRSC
jgi:hypothetical protein